MKILITSHFFWPSVGGVQTFIEILAKEFVKLGHEVILVTHTLNDSSETKKFPYRIFRQPSHLKILKLIKWADIFFQNGINLKYIWGNCFYNKPCFIVFHGPIGQEGIIHDLKYFFLGKYSTISVSKGITKLLGDIPYEVIHNPFANDQFKLTVPITKRKKHLVFLGRLIKEKGAEIVIDSLIKLRKKGKQYSLTIIGEGTEKKALIKKVADNNLSDQIKIVGKKSGAELVNLLNEHQIMIIPSNYPEAFGIVALEGIACGCSIIASNAFGLPEAVGTCGLLFKMGDIGDCAQKISLLADNRKRQKQLLINRNDHMKSHSPEKIAIEYISVFQKTIQKT
jgi:glycosyltransferase involved in cell wall biosynthesis